MGANPSGVRHIKRLKRRKKDAQRVVAKMHEGAPETAKPSGKSTAGKSKE